MPEFRDLEVFTSDTLRPPQQWEGSIHMAWGAIDSKVVEICRRHRQTRDLIGDVLRDLRIAGFRAYYDPLERCFEVAAPSEPETRETAGDFLKRVTEIPSATMPTDVAAELTTIAADTLKEIGDER